MGAHTSSHIAARSVARAVSIAIVTVALVLALAARASAHEHGVLRLVSKTLRAGDSLTIHGAKFEHDDEVTLFLIGVAGRMPLGDAPTDSAGQFSRKFLVPVTAREGQYRLVAEAIDGDEVASVQVVVQAASAAAPPMEAMHAGAGQEGMQMEPTGEPLVLARATNPAVRWTAILLIIASVAAGAALLRTPHVHSREEGL